MHICSHGSLSGRNSDESWKGVVVEEGDVWICMLILIAIN